MKTNKLVLLLLIASCFTSHPFPAFAQVTILADSTHTFDISDCILRASENKTRFYFRTDYSLTSSSCASFFRESVFDSTRIVFDGPFKDYRYDSLLLAEGSYKDGVLDGPIVVRYMNGKIWQKGTFDEGIMVGRWEYFYPDGDKMYVLEFVDKKTKIIDAWDHNGNRVVKDGRGVATIYHYKFTSRTKENNYSWQGKVRHGFMVGKWYYMMGTTTTNLLQYYVNGNFTKGYLSKRMFNNGSHFTPVQEQAFKNAELLSIAECSQNPANDTTALYPEGLTKLKERLDDVFYIQKRKEISYTTKENKFVKLSVTFDVDEKGILSNYVFDDESGIDEFMIEALKNLGPWLPATQNHKPIRSKVFYTYKYFNPRHYNIHIRSK